MSSSFVYLISHGANLVTSNQKSGQFAFAPIIQLCTKMLPTMLPMVRSSLVANKASFFVPARTFLFGFFAKYNKKLIYPPSPNQITTKNRLFPTYIENATELGTLVLTKEPLLLNFTLPGDEKCNKLTGALFDILSDRKKYPLDVSKSVGLANISCDSAGGRELLSTYAVGNVPTVVLLKNQMVSDRFTPVHLDRVGDELTEWIKSIY